MNDAAPALLNSDDLRRLARAFGAGPVPCAACTMLVCPGWESLPGSFDRSRLRRVGTLQAPGDEEPTLAEHHPDLARSLAGHDEPGCATLTFPGRA